MPVRMYRVVLRVSHDVEFDVEAGNESEALEEACERELCDGSIVNEDIEPECLEIEVQ